MLSISNKPFQIKLLLLIAFSLFILLTNDNLFAPDTKIYSHYTPFKVFIATLCFGIIISASIYNMALYIFSRDKRYLYYALGQFSVLIFLASLDNIHIVPLNEIFTFGHSHLIFDISHIAILLFSVLFIKYFLGITKDQRELYMMIEVIKYAAWLDLLLTLILSHSVITRVVPVFLPVWLLISEANRILKEKDKAFYFFYYGWNMVIIMGIIVYTDITVYLGLNFPFLHLTFAMESLILSLAIAYKMKVLEDERVKQQTLLLQQSRLASMGEMISIIAHQWRQPLTHLSYIFMNMKKRIDNRAFLNDKLQEGRAQINYMSQTIELFSNFYNPSKEKEEFSVTDACNKAITIAQPALKRANIHLTITTEGDFTLFGNKNEFEQVILNIINNARDIILHSEIENGTIKLSIHQNSVTITDNGGGIQEKNINRIFEPYFTTKKSDGIGLYISKTIIEKEFSAQLIAENLSDGARFTISF